MNTFILLIGPTLMIFIGLQVFGSVEATFLLFYGWLLAVPLIDRSFPTERFKMNSKTVVLGAGSGLLFLLFIYGGLHWLHVYLMDVDRLRVLLLEWGFSGRGELWLALVLLVANPILEEVYWRGYIYEKLRKNGSGKDTIFITAIFYTLYHLLSVIPIFEGVYGMIAALPVLIAGLFWGYIREKTASITAPIIGHALSDLGIVMVYWFIVR